MAVTYSRLSDHPSQPQEEHNTPNAHHVANENSFDPAEFVAYSIIVMCFNCLLFNWLLLVVKIIGFAMRGRDREYAVCDNNTWLFPLGLKSSGNVGRINEC